MFTTIIIRPIFNLLVLIYAIIPGHNFGLAIIIFTVLVRLLMWPLVKKQIHQARAMRELAPELKKIKAAAKGDRQKESMLTMELYREREINPFASLGILLVQLPIIIGLYSSLNRIIKDPHTIINFSYGFMHHLGWLKQLGHNIGLFDHTLLGVVNLTRTSLSPAGLYWAGLLIVAASAIAQYLSAKQLMPQNPDAKSLRTILKEASAGKEAGWEERNAATMKSTQTLIPFIVFIVTIRLAVGLSLYWLVSNLTAYLQQSSILKKDVAIADASVNGQPAQAEIVQGPSKNPVKKAKKSAKRRKRR